LRGVGALGVQSVQCLFGGNALQSLSANLAGREFFCENFFLSLQIGEMNSFDCPHVCL
jgi:hypothetical protein